MFEGAAIRKIDVEAWYDRFTKAFDLETGLSVSEWIIRNTYLNGEPFGFAGFEYLLAPVDDNYPRQAIIKPAQVGASEALVRKMFCLLYRYASIPYYYEESGEERCVFGINGIYSFPSHKDLNRFVKDRVMTDIINTSPALHDSFRQSESQSNDQVGIYNSFCYFTGRKSDESNQSVPAEIVFIDEYDRPISSDRRAWAALAARTGQAKIFTNKYHRGLNIGFSTPTVPDETGALIEGQYHLSDQREYFVKCHRCGEWQIVTYPDSIAYFYEKGGKKPKKEPYWKCLKCDRPLDFTQIGKWRRSEPHKIHNAEWVAKYPERTEKGDGIRGYRLPFATQHNTAIRILTKRDDLYKHSTQDFYNYGLGLAYRDNAIGILDEDFVRHSADIPWGIVQEGQTYVFGVDQGCYLTVAGLKPDTQTDTNPRGIWQICWCEYINDRSMFSRAIKKADGTIAVQRGEIGDRIDYWNPSVVIMDRLPNVASAEAEAELYKETFWLNDSKGNDSVERIKYEEFDSEGNIVHRMVENKHLAIDEYYQQVRSAKWEFPTVADEEFARFKTHHKNVKKFLTEKGGFRYERFGMDDHYLQSAKLASEAAELHCMLKPRSKRAGILIIGGFGTR